MVILGFVFVFRFSDMKLLCFGVLLSIGVIKLNFLGFFKFFYWILVEF